MNTTKLTNKSLHIEKKLQVCWLNTYSEHLIGSALKDFIEHNFQQFSTIYILVSIKRLKTELFRNLSNTGILT